MGTLARDQIANLEEIRTSDPTVNDDLPNGFPVGSHMLNSVTKVLWRSVGDLAGAADWRTITVASAADPEIDHIVSLNVTVPVDKVRVGRNIHIQDGVELRILAGAEYLLL